MIAMIVTRRMVAAVSLLGAALAGAPDPATAASPRQSTPPATGGTATLYVLTENMKTVPRGRSNAAALGRRIATGAISGFASPGSPLCPSDGGPSDCVVNAQGKDNISLRTGLGTFQGQFVAVIQGDNPVDGPEEVVSRGGFLGELDFSSAVLHEIPFGTVVGQVHGDGGRRASITGVLRLPFAGNATTEVEVAPGVTVTLTLRQLFCPATPDPNPYASFYGGIDLAYLDNVNYATTPTGRCLDIEPNELSLGVPLVRFDISF